MAAWWQHLPRPEAGARQPDPGLGAGVAPAGRGGCAPRVGARARLRAEVQGRRLPALLVHQPSCPPPTHIYFDCLVRPPCLPGISIVLWTQPELPASNRTLGSRSHGSYLLHNAILGAPAARSR